MIVIYSDYSDNQRAMIRIMLLSSVDPETLAGSIGGRTVNMMGTQQRCDSNAQTSVNADIIFA